MSLTFGPAGLTVVAPLPGGHYRIVATVDQAPATPDSPSCSDCWTNAAPAGRRITGLAWSSRFRVHHRVADHYRAGRLLLAGDAAHVHSPAGGQGMNTGIQDGHALGRALATGRLDDYETRRRPVAQRVVAFADRMTRIATTRNPAARHARNTALPCSATSPASAPNSPPNSPNSTTDNPDPRSAGVVRCAVGSGPDSTGADADGWAIPGCRCRGRAARCWPWR